MSAVRGRKMMIEESVVRLIEAFLSFISSWPFAVLIVVAYFRKQIAELILNISYWDSPFGKIQFQKQDPEAIKTLKETVMEKLDPRGFYTRYGLSNLITESDLIQKDEKVVDMLLLFETRKQHTWIISTNRQLFCVLDDENTRSSGRMIQWKMLLSQADPIRARISAKGNPVVDIGERKSWLYSRDLYPTEEELENRIKRLIKEEQEKAQ